MAKVLIIEDEKAMSDLVAVKFRVEGFEADQAMSFAEAKEGLSANSYQAILTDYLLPDGDLADFLSALQSDPKTQGMPIVVMTNYIEDVNVEKLKALGVSEVLVKYQVVPAQMVEKIKTLIGQGSGAASQQPPAPQKQPE